MARLTDMLKNQVRLTATLATSFVELRNSLESVNTVNKQQLDVVDKARTDAKADLESEHAKHDKLREDLLNKVDKFSTEINEKATEIARLNQKIRTDKEATDKQIRDLSNQVRELRDAHAQKENVLDRPDGRITFVDYKTFEVRTNITYSMGARPQMHMTIFDQNSAGIPTERPKGTIELTYVGDRYSIGRMVASDWRKGGDANRLSRIIGTTSATDPIRVGDIVYSPAWSPNEPMRFALIGKIDVNRDGLDDRADLIRMIQAAGGIVDYDLPPPYAGKERGKLSGRDAWYVTDERPPLRLQDKPPDEKESAENTEFLNKRSAAVREARDNGVRPLSLARLLAYLGYDYAAPIKGRAEAVDTKTLKILGLPRQDAAKPKAAEPAAPKDEAKPDEEPKTKDEAESKDEEMPKDEPK
jgi:hypothetical protein